MYVPTLSTRLSVARARARNTRRKRDRWTLEYRHVSGGRRGNTLLRSETTRVTAIHLSPVLSLENDFPRYRISRDAVRPIRQPAAGAESLSPGAASRQRRNVLHLGADDEVAVQVVVVVPGGNGGGAGPPAPVITSDDPLLPTRTTPSFYVPDGCAHIRGVSG